MTLISIQGWSKLLYVNTDERANIWLVPSKVVGDGMPLHTYTLVELLTEWAPPPNRSH